MAKSAPRLSVDYDGMRDSSLNLEYAGEQLLQLATQGPAMSSPFDGLPSGALGVVGEAARSRHNEVYHEFIEDLATGARSARVMGRIVKSNREGYATAEGTTIKALLRVPGSRPYLLAEQVNWDLPQGKQLMTDPSSLDEFREAQPLREVYEHKGYQGALLGIGGAVAGGAGAAIAFDATRESARFAATSQRTLAVLQSAAKVAAPLTVATTLWMTAVSTDDEAVEHAIDWWWGQAQELSELFGDLSTRKVLAEAWQGDARNEADRVLRAFMTAGSQRFELALGQVRGLQDAVRMLNALHDIAFYATALGAAVIQTLAAFGKVNPQAEIVKEIASRTVARRVSDLVKRIALQMGIVAGLLAPVALGMRGDLDGDPIQDAPAGVPEADFPKVAGA